MESKGLCAIVSDVAGLTATISRRLSAETGVIRKDHGGRLRVCLVYPNTYFVGMSSLGFQTVYHLFNSLPDVVCERTFLPDPDDLAEMKRTGSPPVSYESETPLHQFDVIAFSISYELDYVNAARILRLANVPVMAAERDGTYPLIVAGGVAVSINPEPLADIVDLFVIGEVEPVYEELLDALAPRTERSEVLARVADLPGIYCPAASALKHRSNASARPTVARQYAKRLTDWPTYSRILTPETEFGDLFLVEVSRGCGRGCRFCVTPACYWPLRWRPAESVLEAARIGLGCRDAIGLIGAAVSDHPGIDEIASGIVDLGARVSVSSLRADSVSPALIKALAQSGARSITIAPEAGGGRLRAAIGKGISEDQIIGALQMASAGGIKEAKLYFMVGLPGEGEDDVAAIPTLVRKCLRAADLRRVTVAAGAFVPKPHTPYEREGMPSAAELARRLRAIRDELRGERRVVLALESANWSYLEGALSRGDRRLGQVIARADESGGNLAAWRKAFRESGVTPEQFAAARGADSELPWAVIK